MRTLLTLLLLIVVVSSSLPQPVLSLNHGYHSPTDESTDTDGEYLQIMHLNNEVNAALHSTRFSAGLWAQIAKITLKGVYDNTVFLCLTVFNGPCILK